MDKLLEGTPEKKPDAQDDEEWDSDFPEGEELEEILRNATVTDPDTEKNTDAENDSDATDIEGDDRGEALGYDSDRSEEEPETAEDRAFINDSEPSDATASHSAILQQKKEEDENAWLQR